MRIDGLAVPNLAYYRMPLRRGAVAAPIMVWIGWPLDEDGNEREAGGYIPRAVVCRRPDWQIKFERIWPQAAKTPISESEHEYLCRVHAWARRNQRKDEPLGNPWRPIERATIGSMF